MINEALDCAAVDTYQKFVFEFGSRDLMCKGVPLEASYGLRVCTLLYKLSA